jgi:hypothetical protein
MSAVKKFARHAGTCRFLEEAHTTIYVPTQGEYDEDDLMFVIENYHPMEELEEGYEVVALCKKSPDEEPLGFVAVHDEEDIIVVYEDGNDEPLDTPASQVTLTLPK